MEDCDCAATVVDVEMSGFGTAPGTGTKTEPYTEYSEGSALTHESEHEYRYEQISHQGSELHAGQLVPYPCMHCPLNSKRLFKHELLDLVFNMCLVT